MKLKKEVRKVLVISTILIVILLLIGILKVQRDKAIETCIANGQDRQVCERGLK